jgi:hypothetical protein
MQATRHCPIQRRISAAALKQEILVFLAGALPAGWISQPLAAGNRETAADILIISPRGRCHFLFVRAPADRWWDGGPHSVAAQSFSLDGICLARKLRAAGHKARAIWDAKDLARAFEAWGCPLNRAVRLGMPPLSKQPPSAEKPNRPVLRLRGPKGQANA